MSTTDGLMLSW